ncbi:probable carnitine transporter [Cephalotrichum gorgonifer]|uniref:Probable carnitine transporter n=1 Tax=Cephalotrichum gorgonifer TaxID=2041049 RepID=A0AAE8MTI4_9PEZI|nr:probable carnitine transporter [Cephalotrichum gorgonifer]
MLKVESKSSGGSPSLPPYHGPGSDSDNENRPLTENVDSLQRRLNNRQIQLVAIGGSIGTALFISIGTSLAHGGPGSLLISWVAYCCVMALVNNCITEMSVLMPVSGGFIRLAGLWVDDAFGFMAGWNFFLYEALLIPFEITALNLVLSYWVPVIAEPGPMAGFCAAVIVAYGLLNVVAVRTFGEAEFWLSGGKVVLIFMLFFFTFVTMCGGNPQHDAYGFRYWKEPGAFAEHFSTGNIGRFEGFLAALWGACFAVVGPEYISMVAAEAKRPRIYIKQAFKTVYWRFLIFFAMSALCVGIVVPYNDPVLLAIITGEKDGGGTAAASPYVIAMNRMKIGVFPHITNALIFTSIFSAGNTYTYCAIRALHSLALEGRAPRVLTKCTKSGVPIYCFAIVMCFPLLSFLQVSSNSSVVLGWLVALVTAGGLINYNVMCITYIFYWRAIKAQGVDRSTFPYRGWFQPYSAYIALAVEVFVIIFAGYGSFRPPNVEAFFQSYTMVILAPLLFFSWKLIKKTSFVKPLEADLVYQRPVIDAYEAALTGEPVGFWTEMGELIGIKRRKKGDAEKR